MIHGARISLYVAAVSIGVAMLVGGAFGLTAGYQGGVDLLYGYLEPRIRYAS